VRPLGVGKVFILIKQELVMREFWSLVGKGLFMLMGWNFEPLPPYFLDKHVIIGFPHTTNMDTVRAFTGFRIAKRTGHVMIKKEWFRWPMSVLMKAIGGIPVDRNSSQGVVGQMVRIFSERNEFLLAIVPEGTRKDVTTIKTGFWHIAKEANVSILLWYLDNNSKTTRWLGEVVPGDDKVADILKIREIYASAGYVFPLDVDRIPKEYK
jgi:1-acyl-sn-glycerol-3-phosphate acyltransferase